MTDLDQISALLHRYARAVDTKDWELYRSVFTKDAVIDYSSNGIMSMHYITNIEADVAGDAAKVRAMFYNPTQLPGMSELSYFRGYYSHDLVRDADGWRSRHLAEQAVWAVNGPGG